MGGYVGYATNTIISNCTNKIPMYYDSEGSYMVVLLVIM